MASFFSGSIWTGNSESHRGTADHAGSLQEVSSATRQLSMKETCEFRVVEEFAPQLFGAEEGKRLGDSVRQIEVETNDPRFGSIGRLQLETRARTNRSFFYGWILKRSYSASELRNAACFHLLFKSTFEPAGEECGTIYEESIACPRCGAGAKQTSPLFLDVKRIPKSKDICRTIAGEVVVSRRVAELFARHGITGAELRPLLSKGPSSAESKEWFQLAVQGPEAEISAPTRVGIDPFDDDEKGECRCPLGDLIGLNLLSEITITSASRGSADIIRTRQFIGTRRGLLRPEQLILISPKFAKLIESEKLKGCGIEVAHLA
jgi:hypothetical protein